METSKNNKLWCRVYRAELKKRGGVGEYAHNLNSNMIGESAAVADAAVKEAKEEVTKRKAARND